MTHTAPKTIELVELAPATIHALAGGDLTAANLNSRVAFTAYFVAPENLRTWRMRSRQIDADPVCAGWITRIIVNVERQIAVGQAGFHGPPDTAGMVELGYSIDPDFRRQGYARAALVAMLDQASVESSVCTVRATISPDNIASRSLVLQYGFVEVGEQWDDEDGLETIFEVAVKQLSSQILQERSR